MHSDPIFGRRWGLVIPISWKKVPKRHSGLHPSNKELPELRSGTFHHKMPLLALIISKSVKSESTQYENMNTCGESFNSFVTVAYCILGCSLKRQPPDPEVSCKCVDYIVTESHTTGRLDT
jgi:hypothetical protein